MDVIYLDFSKAFDKVPYKRLLMKMKMLGVSGYILKWVESWLINRKQLTMLNGTYSSWIDVLSRVPQGSVLGPLLFVIFINDIDDCAENIDILLKFADDTKLGHNASSIEECVKSQECLNKLINWANSWNMSFNISKCKVLHVGRNNLNHIYTMNGTPLEVTTVEWDIAVPAWSPWLQGDIETLEKVQRRAINLVVGLRGRTYEEKLAELGMRTLEDRRKRLDLVQTFKINKGIDKVESTK